MFYDCPNCKADLREKEIHPQTGEPYSRCIGLYDQGIDATYAWKCPECNWIEPRKGYHRAERYCEQIGLTEGRVEK